MGLIRKIRRLRDRRKYGQVRPRREILLERIDVATQVGIEIGALCNPLVTKSESNGKVVYVDYASAEQLREHFRHDPNVRLDEIVETDLIWGNRRLPELVGDRRFDYVLASHVIEHTPNMIGWLREIATVLRDDGILALAIPDKRYTFDMKRELTSLATLVEYFLQDRRRPSTRDVFDHKLLTGPVDLVRAWSGTLHPDEVVPMETLQQAWEGAQLNETSETYIDVHVSVVTPLRFLELISGMNRLGLFDFTLLDFVDTQRNALEFFVTLARTPRAVSREEAIARQDASIAAAIAQLTATTSKRVAPARNPA